MIPSSKQWRKWTLPSKMTAASFYLAIISILIPFVSFISIKIFQHYSNNYDVMTVVPGRHVFDELMPRTYEERKEDINVSYPRISYLFTNRFYEGLNREIENNALSYLGEDLYQYEFSYRIGLQNDDLLSIKIMQYYYYYPALNGNASIFSINVEPSNSRVIDFFDVFDARRDALTQIKDMIAEEFPKNCDVWDDIFNKNNYIPRFFVHKYGVEFIFSEYEITPGFCGSFIVDLKYEKLISDINPNGPLGKILPATGEWQAENHFIKGISNAMKKLENSN